VRRGRSAGDDRLSNRGTPYCSSGCGFGRIHRFVAGTSIKGECRGQEEQSCSYLCHILNFAPEEASGPIF
jgi:hypothetical protein